VPGISWPTIYLQQGVKMKHVSFLRMMAAGLTMWLGLSAGVANASSTTTLITYNLTGPNYWSVFSGASVSGSSFTDNFNFTIPGAIQPVAQGVSATISAGGTATFSGFNLWDYTTSSLVAIGTALTPSSWQVNFTIPSGIGQSLTDNFGFIVTGTPVGLNGSYSLDSHISAVPEPEIYVMMLAGLGLLGFSARRRKSSNGNFA
jgi:hypothetical protein